MHPSPTRTTRIVLRLFLFILAAALPLSAALPDLPARHPKDRSEYRRMVLDNGLRVLLLSDPDLNISSAALAVNAGALDDPEERQGLAHFTEHMLFLGTEKYPEVNDFGNYLQSNGGYNNAYTAGDVTNYHFEIRHEALEGALDRFSQFFIAPLFTQEFSDREKNAVNSEHQKNLENDHWRSMRLFSLFYAPGHPERKFGTGCLATLDGVTRDEFLAFYKSHYSANRMALVIASREPLDLLESWARRFFSAIPDHGLPAPSQPARFIESDDAVRIIRMEPLKDVRRMEIEFCLPATRAAEDTKTAALLGFILGYEGPGSLLSTLKAQDLATALGASVWEPASGYSALHMSIELTPAGLEQSERVLELVFAQFEVLRRAGYPSRLFEERATMARLDELYTDRGEGADRAAPLANLALFQPLELAERMPYLYARQDPALYQRLLDALSPRNMLVLLQARGLETDSTESIYGTRYGFTRVTGPLPGRLEHPAIPEDLRLPDPNPYIPASAALLTERPVILVDDPVLTLCYSQDVEFERPQASLIFRFRPPASLATLENSVLLEFYQACVQEAVNETAYTASMAGLDFSVSASFEGVDISVNGYDSSAAALLRDLTGRLLSPDIGEARFAALKDRIVRALEDFPRQDAMMIARAMARAVRAEVQYMPAEQLPVARGVTREQVLAFAASLFKAGRIEALVHGNIDAPGAVAVARDLQSRLGCTPLPPEALFTRRILTQPAGERLVDATQADGNNSALWREALIGGDTPELRAATMVIDNFIGEPVYTELRTRQQLGYVVHAGTTMDEWQAFAVFVIQSPGHPADDIAARLDAFREGLLAQFDALGEEGFATLVAGVRSTLEKREKSIGEKAAVLFARAYKYHRDWNRRADTLAALDRLTPAGVRAILAAMLDPASGSSRTMLVYARQHPPAATPAASFTDRAAWKAGRRYE